MKHELRALACAGGAALMAVGLSGTATAAPQLVDQGKISSIILSTDDVSSIVGATMSYEKPYSLPQQPAEVTGDKACAVAFGLNEDTYGDDYEVVKADVQQDGDGDNFDHLVYQQAAIYSDTDTPTKLFHDAFAPLSKCDKVHVSSNPDNVDWQVKVKTVTDSGAQWTRTVLVDGSPNGYRCAHDARVQSNVMLDVLICQTGNPARTVSLLADRMIAGTGASSS